MTSTPDVPPFTGAIDTTLHALRLIHAARQGVIPRITRRLNDSERRTMIKSGAVFVFSVDESGIKRWTDGLLWSPSRIVGNFLVYREINERTSSRGGNKKTYPLDIHSGNRRSSPDNNHHTVAFKGPGHLSQGDHGTFKANGLIKKTITVTIEGSDLHLISYYTSDDIRSGRLKKPTSRPDIMSLPIPPHIFRLTNFRVPPKIETGPDGKPRLVCEAEDLESPAEYKIEGHAYETQGSAPWTPHADSIHHPRRIVNSHPAGTGYQEGHGNALSSINLYSREGTDDRCSVNVENSRIAPMARQDFNDSWSSNWSHATLQSPDLSRRRDSWSTRWRSDSYSMTTVNGVSADRSRSRSSTVYDNPGGTYRRDDSTPRYGLSTEVADNNRGAASPRMSWLPREAPADDKYLRNSHIAPSFSVANPSSPFPQSSSYSRMNHSSFTWGSSDSGESVNPPFHAVSPQSVSMSPYDSYTSSDF